MVSVQNALPVWHTHSTVTGTATSLGLANASGTAQPGAKITSAKDRQEEHDDELAAHYAKMAGHADGDDDLEEDVPVALAVPVPAPTPAPAAVAEQSASQSTGRTVLGWLQRHSTRRPDRKVADEQSRASPKPSMTSQRKIKTTCRQRSTK